MSPRIRRKLSTVARLFAVAAAVTALTFAGLQVSPAQAATSKISPHSWDAGLFAVASNSGDAVHAWGKRSTSGAWGTGSVNYQSGGTTNNRGNSSGKLDVDVKGTYCPGGKCSYGTGSGYKGLVQFWNDASNFLAVGVIHDPGVSPSGTTLMIEGSANGRPVGGYFPAGGLPGSAHHFAFSWTASGIKFTIDGTRTLGPYPVTANHPSISFLAAGRDTGDVPDVTFSNINYSSGAISGSPYAAPAGDLYSTMSATVTQSGSGSGYSAYLNTHDASGNAISVGIQTDRSAPEAPGRPYYVWERVQNGVFTYGYVKPAASNSATNISLQWYTKGTAVFMVGNEPIAEIPVNLAPRLFFGVEGNARLNGDTVRDTFTNTQVTAPYGIIGAWNTNDFNFHGLKATRTNGNTQNGANFAVSGTASGIPAGGDWDSNLVAGIGMIAQGQ
jgi:hypothetical protein